MEVENCFYRVSVKALVLDEPRKKFLICKKESEVWELPGGGLDWGTTPHEDLPREIKEEMGLEVVKMAKNPSYFMTSKTLNRGMWIVNVLYETELDHLDFTPSDECIETKFVNTEDIVDMHVFPTVKKLAEMFDPKRHVETL